LATRKNNTNTVGSTSANLGFEAKLWAGTARAMGGSPVPMHLMHDIHSASPPRPLL